MWTNKISTQIITFRTSHAKCGLTTFDGNSATGCLIWFAFFAEVALPDHFSAGRWSRSQTAETVWEWDQLADQEPAVAQPDCISTHMLLNTRVYNVQLLVIPHILLLTVSSASQSSPAHRPIAETPHQLVSFLFPKRPFGKKNVVYRSFQPSRFTSWKWLHYDETTDAVLCQLCCVWKEDEAWKCRCRLCRLDLLITQCC